MGFYMRKSISVGPFRFNLSKSGIGVSAGFPGFRVGTGPRGNYVHMGAGGLYYRKTLSSSGRGKSAGKAAPIPATAQRPATAPRPTRVPPALAPSGQLQEIESGAATNMAPESAKELLKQINDKHRTVRLGVAALVIGLAIAAGLYFGGQPAAAAVALLLTALAAAAGHASDVVRRSVVLFYDLDEAAYRQFEAVTDAFDGMKGAGRVWHIEAEGRNANWKRNAGAMRSQQRRTITLGSGAPAVVKCNIDVPVISVGKQQMYFFPDRMLFVERSKVGAVEYGSLNVEVRGVNFVEDETVPADASVIGQTWKHPNKSGGPDRRFRDNRQIPICAYEEAYFTSGSGLNELIQFSREGLVPSFANSLRVLGAMAAQLRVRP